MPVDRNPDKKPQRNALRSQKLIKKAFAALLHEKELGKITVSDIVKEAEICRGTFYAHYIDIDDLFEQIKQDMVDTVTVFIDTMGVVSFFDNPRPDLEKAFSAVEKDKEFYKNLLLNKSATAVSESIINMFRDRFVDELCAAYPAKTKDEVRALLVYIANGVQGLFVKWLCGGASLPTDKLICFICNMIHGSKTAFAEENI